MKTYDLLSPDVCKMIGVTRRSLARYRAAGTGPPYIRLESGGVRYSRVDVEEWLEARTVAG